MFEDEDDDLPVAERDTFVPVMPHTTYRPGRHEAGWLEEALLPWFEDETLIDLLFCVRGGKEATVYACRGGPGLDGQLVAAKVYRPRRFRELSNDALYREGRRLLDDRGHGVRRQDRRMGRAVRRGTRIGKKAAHISWLQHEVSALQTLHEAGAPVPTPLGANRRAVLMSFVGDERGAAPTLDGLRPGPELAASLYAEALQCLEILLECGLVHGDLSPYNLLVWEDRLTMIDLPQAVPLYENPYAAELFRRDVARICTSRALGRPGPDPERVADRMWNDVFGTDTGVPLRMM